MAEEQQSSGCSACDQMGQPPTPEHLAGVARFEARQQAATGEHRQNDEYPAFCRCLSRWPCELAADELAAENARLRERVAALEAAGNLMAEAVEDAAEVGIGEDEMADLVIGAGQWRAALAGQEQAGQAGEAS